MKGIQSVGDELPTLITKLEGLHQLHEESADLMLNLQNMVVVHNKILQEVDNDQELIK